MARPPPRCSDEVVGRGGDGEGGKGAISSSRAFTVEARGRGGSEPMATPLCRLRLQRFAVSCGDGAACAFHLDRFAVAPARARAYTGAPVCALLLLLAAAAAAARTLPAERCRGRTVGGEMAREKFERYSGRGTRHMACGTPVRRRTRYAHADGPGRHLRNLQMDRDRGTDRVRTGYYSGPGQKVLAGQGNSSPPPGQYEPDGQVNAAEPGGP